MTLAKLQCRFLIQRNMFYEALTTQVTLAQFIVGCNLFMGFFDRENKNKKKIYIISQAVSFQ